MIGRKVKTNRMYSVGALLVSATLLLSGCATGDSSGSGMMDSNSNYYDSRLDCQAPTNLPGSIVNVVLSDMGIRQMMGGVAPMGAHMRLIASPRSISTFLLLSKI